MKTIKIETLEKRFDKLHKAANYAEECGKAIVFHAARLSQLELTSGQMKAYNDMEEAVEQWCDMFAKLASAMQEVEGKYYDQRVNDSDCELIQAVPSFKKNGYTVPETFPIDAKLFDIGYYELEGDPYNVAKHDFSVKETLADIQFLWENMVFFVKALANAEYEGIWQPVGEIVISIYDAIPNQQISYILENYKQI